VFGKHLVRQYIYPALHQPASGLKSDDQFGFRPSGSTTAAIIAMLDTVRTMLTSHQYVRLLCFDFSKAFDTVRHATLMHKMAALAVPDIIYNWIKDFHRTLSPYEIRQSRRWKPASYKARVSVQRHTWSRQQICSTLWSRAIVSSNSNSRSLVLTSSVSLATVCSV